MRRLRVLAVASVVSLALAGCAGIEPRTPYTAAESADAAVPGFGMIRFYADAPVSTFDRTRAEVFAAARARHEPVTYLALSSGGSDGAFGAGFLKGLTETNRRPTPTIVSGVSTGALMAPFVFLGPRYDAKLEDIYTGGYAATLVKDVNILNGLTGNALVDSDRLLKLIARHVDEGLLREVAEEHRKGRRLLIVTTNLDAQRSVVWDLGAIAASGSPDALRLFRQVLAASASIPGLFPPRLVKVTSQGRVFQEMHVDGATLRPLFLLPDELLFGPGGKSPDRLGAIYAVVNSKMDPTFEVVDNSAVAVAARSLASVVKRATYSSALSTYAYAQTRGIPFHVASIGADVPEPPASDAAEQFSTSYMQATYARGETLGRSAEPWASRPPLALDPPPTSAPTPVPDVVAAQ